MAKKTKRARYVVVQMKVSIPKAGEFIVGIPIIETFCGGAPLPAEIAYVATEDVMARIKVAPVAGELKRVAKKFKARS